MSAAGGYPSRGTIVLAGSVAQRPGQGGHTWVFLQYLLGFRRLGWDVLLLDRLEPEMCRDAGGRPCEAGRSLGFLYLAEAMREFGLAENYAVDTGGGEYLGLPRREVLGRVRRSALVLNVMGFLGDEEVLAAAPRRVFLDIDPGFPQMWREMGQADVFRGHDDFVTVGLNVGREGSVVPTCGLKWLTTVQPVVLEHWPTQPPNPRGPVTSVCTWRGDWGGVEFGGRTYGLRVHEFRKFVALPRLAPHARFEIAVDIHANEGKDIALLDENGWNRTDPAAAAADPECYARFIAGSSAEFMVAKNLYVDTRGGWFSDRSICYLASGRPVLAQDTGFRTALPAGDGLLAFSTLDEARAGIEEIFRDYNRHARAARAVAEECFDSDKVLRRLLERLGVN